MTDQNREQLAIAFARIAARPSGRGVLQPGVVVEIDKDLQIHFWHQDQQGSWSSESAAPGKLSAAEMSVRLADPEPLRGAE